MGRRDSMGGNRAEGIDVRKDGLTVSLVGTVVWYQPREELE